VCLLTNDLEQTATFYTKGLGLEKAFDFEREGRLFGYYLKCGQESYIEVFQGQPGQPGSITHLCLEVESIDAVIAHLTREGIAVTAKKKGSDGNYQAWIEDPNGVKIELMEYGPDCCQKTGQTCIVNW
ncbi:MAG TPA: VOC family protein, partial [Oceanipulchritudo sp.]|nr:VOC family protein [Oceanipulchritudo sp.]